jgi:hypothetical protein
MLWSQTCRDVEDKLVPNQVTVSPPRKASTTSACKTKDKKQPTTGIQDIVDTPNCLLPSRGTPSIPLTRCVIRSADILCMPTVQHQYKSANTLYVLAPCDDTIEDHLNLRMAALY